MGAMSKISSSINRYFKKSCVIMNEYFFSFEEHGGIQSDVTNTI
jgi:hypothetical protein